MVVTVVAATRSIAPKMMSGMSMGLSIIVVVVEVVASCRTLSQASRAYVTVSVRLASLSYNIKQISTLCRL
jgi:hypothetical protein